MTSILLVVLVCCVGVGCQRHETSSAAADDGHGIYVFVELRDPGYPGATYKLIYQAASDQLTGAYHQPTHGETFAVNCLRQ